MAPATDEETKRLFEGLDYLGKPSDIGLTGTSDVPAGATGLPAPSAPGGMAGFAGGAGAPGGGPGQGGPGALGLTKSAIDAAIKSGKFGQQLFADPDLGTRGNVGGEGQPQQANQSLSDQIRSLIAGGGQISPLADFSGQTGGASVTGQLADVLSGPGGSVTEQLKALGLEGLGGSAGGGLGGLASGASLAGGGAAALGAILGLIAQATGDPEMAKAAQAVGAAGSAASLVGTGASAAGGAIAAGTAGLGAGAGAAFAPIAAMMLASTISGMAGGEDPVGEGMGEIFGNRSTGGDYPKFAADLMANQGQQGQAFSVLQQALPYVQSKEELGQLLNSYRNYLSTTQAAPVEGTDDPYALSKIAGTGPVTHGQQTPTMNWGPQTQALQQSVNDLLGVLPGERITAAYGQPGGGLEGEANLRLWTQFLDREKNFPNYNPAARLYDMTYGNVGGGGVGAATGGGGWQQPGEIRSIPKGHGGPGTSPWDAAYEGTIGYGQPGYSYTGEGAWNAGLQLPKPGEYVGSISPYWQQLQAQRQQAANPFAAQIAAMINGGGRGGAGTGLAEGLLSEEERKRLSQ